MEFAADEKNSHAPKTNHRLTRINTDEEEEGAKFMNSHKHDLALHDLAFSSRHSLCGIGYISVHLWLSYPLTL
jgi:hypothetical protein